jgi:3-oxoadipate enol-lactonase
MYVATRLGRLYYEEHGANGGQTTVLWPSFLTDGGMWDGQIAALEKLGRVVVFDPPGHGHSEPPPPFSLDDNARALLDALDALAIKRFAMAGLSWGGMIGMRVAVLAAERVAALALLDTSAAPEMLRNRIQYRAMLSTFRRVGMPDWLADRRVVPLFFCERTRRERPELATRFWNDAIGFSRDGVYRAGKAIFQRGDFRMELARIRTPVLVMCGAEDRATPPDRSREIASAISGAELVTIEDAGHLSAVEQPEKVSLALRSFFERHAV